MNKLSLRQKSPPALYNSDALKPPGIKNIANNCYANSVVQCLLNVPVFVELIEDITESHKSGVCNLCKTSGMQRVIKLTHALSAFSDMYVQTHVEQRCTTATRVSSRISESTVVLSM